MRGGRKKACYILLWQKPTSFFGINPSCIFDEIYIQQTSGPPTTSWLNEYKVSFKGDKDGKLDVKMVFTIWKINKKAMFKYYKEGRLCIGVAKVESLDKKIIGNRCPVFYFTGGGQ